MSSRTDATEKLLQGLPEGTIEWADALINLLIKIDNDIYRSIKELTKGSTVNLENYNGFIPFFLYFIDRQLYFLWGNSSIRHILMDIMFAVFENNESIWWKHLTSSSSIETELSEFLNQLNQKVKYYHDLALEREKDYVPVPLYFKNGRRSMTVFSEFEDSEFMAAVVDHTCKELSITSVMGENSEDSIINTLIGDHNLDGVAVCPLNQYLSKTLEESLHVIKKWIDDFFKDFFKNDDDTDGSTKRFIPVPLWFIIVRIIAVFMLLFAIGTLPYNYYTVLRLVVCAVTVYGAYYATKIKSRGWAWTLGVTAYLFNPVFPVYLKKSTWEVLDLCVAIVLAASLFLLRKQDR